MEVERIPGGNSLDVWEGRLREDKFSNVSITTLGSAIAGAITTSDSRFYRIHGYRHSAKVEEISQYLSPSSLDDELPMSSGSCPLEPEPEKYVCESPSKASVDVLVVFTPRALERAGGTEVLLASIRVAEARTNRSFAQSGADARIRIVRREVIDYQEVSSTEENLRRLAAGSDGLVRAHELRNAMKADLVVLIVDSPGQKPLACPFPNKESLGNSSFASAAFAVVPVSSLLTFDHFTHEVGHLFGAGHRKSDSGAFDDSHGYLPEPQPASDPWKTIMVRDACPMCAPILYWSNPKIVGIGGPMGIKDKFDNSQTISETACTLAAFR